MENLDKDPIMEFYLSFSQSTPQDTKLPIYSETLLRLAARHALGNMRPVEDETLALYRVLILFYFAETYTSVEDLLKIMPDFTEKEIIECFQDFEKIKAAWLSFTKHNLMYFIRKKAFFAIFTEWVRRYVQLYDDLDSMQLRNQAIKIHSFFQWGTKGINQWLRSFESNTLKGNWADAVNNKLVNVTEKDLQIANVALDIKDQLHPLIYKELEEILKNYDASSDIDSDKTNTSPPPDKILRKDPSKVEDISIDDIQNQRDLSNEYEDNEIVHVFQIFDSETENEEILGIEESSSTEKSIDIKEEGEEDGVVEEEEEQEQEDEEDASIINDNKARVYLSALQAYVVVNGLYDAIPLLDRVDSILRDKMEAESKGGS